MIKPLFSIYELGWRMAAPLLKRNERIRDGFPERSLQVNRLRRADLWIQSASAGESFITVEILKALDPVRPTRVMLTTCTRQGMEILEKGARELAETHPELTLSVACLPFDRPRLMREAVRTIRPGLTVLVELEIWPGMLYALKEENCPAMIVNGRLTAKSLKGYLTWPGLWRHLAPERVLAISHDDKRRFDTLFSPRQCQVVPNIKFDRLTPAIRKNGNHTENPLAPLIQDPFLILGSVRQEEEAQIEKILERIHQKRPELITGLFPRHMHRIETWTHTLTRLGIPWCLRSDLKKRAPKGTVILWDTFGELSHAYEQARAAFVGGSLAPLGGQNFLEPLAWGIIPVIGPSWDNFTWVGEEIITTGLLTVRQGWKEVADTLIDTAQAPPSRQETRERAADYFENRKGGTQITCGHIREYLNKIHARRP